MAESLREVIFRLNRLKAWRRELTAELSRAEALIASAERTERELRAAWLAAAMARTPGTGDGVVGDA